MQFAQQIELTARDLYDTALAAGVPGEVLTAVRENHDAYVEVFRGILGPDAIDGRDDRLLAQFDDSFRVTTPEALADAAYRLESTLVATHTDLLGSLEHLDAIEVIAAIVPIEARHCVVWADIAGRGDDFDVLFENTAEALQPRRSGG